MPNIIENDETITRNYEQSSKERHIKAESFEKPSFFPNIGVEDRIFSSDKLTTSSKCESKAESTTLQLPRIRTHHEIQPQKEEAEDDVVLEQRNYTNKIFSDHMESIQQKHSLEASLKESLRAIHEPKCYLDGDNRSTRHLMLEINEFYIEMAEQLRLLKGNLLNNAQNKMKQIDEQRQISSYETEVNKLIKSIEEDDKKVEENVKVLQDLRQNRRDALEKPRGDQDYTLLQEETNEETRADDPKKIKKNAPCDGKNFVAKNKELAKDYKTSKHCLTNDEKRKLKTLLSDIDVQEENTTGECDQQATQYEDYDDGNINTRITERAAESFVEDEIKDEDNQYNVFTYTNGFKLEPDETELLNNLDVKIINLQQAQIPNQIGSKTDDYDDLKRAESKGKHWKFHLLQKRLKRIERKLAAIQVEKEKENEDDSPNIQAENRVNIEEEYKSSVYEISVDIGEIEYEINKELEMQCK